MSVKIMNKRFNFLANRQKLGAVAILAIIIGSLFLISPQSVQAQMVTADTQTVSQTFMQKVWDFLKKAYEKGGASAFQKTVRTALNKIAYDTATALGSGGEGQQPLFVTKDWGEYLTQIGDEAAGSFIEDAVNNWNDADWDSTGKGSAKNEECTASYETCARGTFNTVTREWEGGCDIIQNSQEAAECEKKCQSALLQCGGVVTGADGVTAPKSSRTIAVCQPSSISAKLTIAMGLVDYNRPAAPNCTASALVENWDSYVDRMTAFKEDDFLDKFAGIFNPVSNDLGIYMALRTDMTQKMATSVDTSKLKLNADKGWLDIRDIAGNPKGMPGDAATQAEMSKQGYVNNMASFSGDALIDAANVFLNQLALTAFNRYMSKLGEKTPDSVSINNPTSDPKIGYSEVAVRESAAQIIEPDFTVRADYDILSSLSMCRDRNNPGPAECVIDDKLMQGIVEKKTVAEAAKEGYLHKEWLFTADFREGSYSLRNLQIMRKYRIVPLGWEVAASANKTATLVDLMSCFSNSDSYNEYTSNFDIRNQAWCRGLVDPNWVLKAPLNYCAKQGYSAQILNTSVIPSVDGNGNAADTIQITRAEDYCADDKTCIKEKADGSCEAYGYCQSERRTWNFDSKSCQPINNTCSSLINVSSNQKVAYLENTLDYANCNADTVGCKRYSLIGSYATSTGQVSWSPNPTVNAYFNNKLGSCSSADEGCKEVMRVKPGWGSNLIMGADFANDKVGDSLANSLINNYWPVWSTGNRAASIIDASTLGSGSVGKAILLESTGNVASTTIGLYSDNAVSLIPDNLNILSGETYTLSADVYLIEGDKVHVVLGNDYLAAAETIDKNAWRHVSVTRSLKEKPLSEMSFSVVGYSTGSQVRFAVRNLKLEMTSWDSGFSIYGAYKVYEKIIPPYLAEACYINTNPSSPDYRLRPDAPAVCNNFARQCNRDEAGCESYKENSTGFTVAAQAVSSDYCDASCDGYDLYVSRANYFYSPFAEKIIPKNSRSCSADAVGCSEFTNLDEVAAGGEKREYYTQLKQCIKPGPSCADFYTWEGTEESGYQLKSLVLKKDDAGDPAVTADDSQLCSEAIFNLPPSDPGFNPDCKQFYNKAGAISYHLSAATITCSDNCHNYRLSENNVDTSITQAQCSGIDRFWSAASSACFVCKNGGVWNAEYNACIYQAIPNEGIKCSAAQNGCREYNGSLGNNVKMVEAYSFENGTDGWKGQCGDDARSSAVANVNNGKSLLYDRGSNYGNVNVQTECIQNNNVSFLDKFFGSANAAPASYIKQVVGRNVSQGNSYSLKFTASAPLDANVSFAFLSSQDEIVYFNASEGDITGKITISGNSEWRTYELSLPELNHEVDGDESLIIISDRDFFLDNIVLTEIRDRYYLIKNTSEVPDVCYYDMLDNYQGADYNLGCSLYNDRSGNNHYLRQFSRLCQESAVGCELMVDTANYDDYKPAVWHDDNNNGVCDSNETECVSVAGDRFFYAIYDESRRCNKADLGCSRLGESSSSGSNLDWSDVFKRNNPNNYNQSLCAAADAGCEAWQYTDGSGLTYFKNPGNNACVYRTSTNPDKPGKAWYKVPVTRCDLNNNGSIDGTEKSLDICKTADDCAGGRPCLVDNNDYDCSVSYFKTVGFGGGGNQVPVPSLAAGLCESASSGCTEYIDPVSTFSSNVVYNPLTEMSANGQYLGWEMVNGSRQQDLTLEPNKLYIFSVGYNVASTTINNDVIINFPSGVSLLQEDNNFSTVASTSLRIPSTQPSKRFIFHSRGNIEATVIGGWPGHEVILREAIIDYQFRQNVDKTTCNGIVNFDNGCVLFNERSVNGGAGLLSLSGGWNAAASVDGQSPASCSAGSCSANRLVKVRPNRVCASWLDCLTYAVDPETNQRTCYALGECNSLNDNNECANFVRSSNQILASSSFDITKRDGYSVLNKLNLSGMREVGLNTEAHYDFEDASQTLYCRLVTSTSSPCIFDNDVFTDSVIKSPTNAPTDYPAEGKAYLRVMAGNMISPHSYNAPISIQSGQDYYLNFLVNTKGSGVDAKVWVQNAANSNLITSATYSSVNGWERRVLKISGVSLNGVDSIRIYFGTTSISKDERYVYFDDINIEPVLQVAGDNGVNSYIAKECRLYPTQDATSCTSKNSKVVSDGLVGYCLQHDLANKNVCLLWYPVDQISAASKSARSNLGYQGAFPLNYCTEANGYFTLVEKRVSIKLDAAHSTHENEWGDDNCETITGRCGNTIDPNYDTIIETNHGDVSAWRRVYCVPRLSSLLFVSSQRAIGGNDACRNRILYEGWGVYNGFRFVQSGQYIPDCGSACDIHCESGDCSNLNEVLNADPNVRVYDYNYPTVDEDDLKLVSSSDENEVYYPTCNRFVQVVDSSGNNKAWAGRTSKFSIYPYETPAFFRDETNYYGSACYLPGDCIETCECGIHCDCDYGAEYCSAPCDVPGDCYEYAPDQIVPCGTPGSLQDSSAFNFTKYGRLRDLVPFGAATFPDNFNIFGADPIMFRSQYSSKLDQKAFAGRPYGCKGTGCANLGYCSLNPQVICLLDTTTSSTTSLVAQKSCGGANGTCIPLWNASKLANNFYPEDILRNTFLKSFAGYKYSSSTSAYISDTLSTYIQANGGSYATSTYLGQCGSDSAHFSSNDSSYATYWCAVRPKITNVKLNGISASNGMFDVSQPGIYTLTFNTAIDIEQQPLRDLIINWGDGSIQSLVNEDHRPDANNPHKLYHFYQGGGGVVKIGIRVFDNWGFFANY